MAKNTQQDENRKPIQTFRSGALSAAIWTREHDGKIFYSVTSSRAFKKDDESDWQYSESLNHDDLPLMAQLLNMCFAWITVQRAKEK